MISSFSIWLWTAHLASVLFMTGLIWLIQMVQYPLFVQVGREEFQAFHRSHSFRITWVVGPVMLTELFSAALLLQYRPHWLSMSQTLTFLFLSLGVFGVTGLVSVPLHGRLEKGFSEGVHRRLVLTNWLRTFLWSAHAVLICWAQFEALGRS
jgi:hypothetical protein